MSFLSGPDATAPVAVQPRAWNVTPAAVASAVPPSGFVTLVTFPMGGGNLTPITNGAPLTKTTAPIAGFVNLIGGELVPAAVFNDSWYYDAANAYPGIQWVRWRTGNIATLGTGDFGGMLSVTQGAGCQGLFFSTAGNLLQEISLVSYIAGAYTVVTTGTELYLPDTNYFAWFDPATGFIELYRGNDDTGVQLITALLGPGLLPAGAPGLELFNGSIAAWSAGIFIP